MSITPALIRELRERTQAGMSDCKKALEEELGDMDKAVDNILKKGLVKAAKTAGKIASEGEVRTHVSANGKRATMVEINSQTDFVSRGEAFQTFVGDVLTAASTLARGADLSAATYPGTSKTVEDARREIAGKTGENIVVRRWDFVEASEHGFVHAYIHMGGKNASILAVDAPKMDDAVKSFVDNVAMQIVAMRPQVVDKTDLTPAMIEKQKEIFFGQLKEEGKPEASWPKIVEGKLNKWHTEVTLLGQDNVWDSEKGTIGKVREELSKSVGGEVTIASFVRFELGEGIEKKVEDLAAEVAKTIGN
jgi:elongation factor Ts